MWALELQPYICQEEMGVDPMSGALIGWCGLKEGKVESPSPPNYTESKKVIQSLFTLKHLKNITFLRTQNGGGS